MQAAAFAANSIAALQTQQQMLDALDLEYDKRIAIANAQGNAQLAADTAAQREVERTRLLQVQANTIDTIQTGSEGLNNGPLSFLGVGWWGQKDAQKQVIHDAINENFKGTDAVGANLAVNKIESAGNFGQQQVLEQL